MNDGEQKPQSAAADDEKQDAKDWPNTVRNRDQLDSALEAGLKSKRGKRTIDEVMESAITRVENG